MIEIRLLTSNREFVSKACIPTFAKLPEVVIWGSRTFKITDNLYWANKKVAEYAECFCYTVPENFEC